MSKRWLPSHMLSRVLSPGLGITRTGREETIPDMGPSKPKAIRALNKREKFLKAQRAFIAKMNANFKSRQITRRAVFDQEFKEVSQQLGGELRKFRRRIARARMHAHFKKQVASI